LFGSLDCFNDPVTEKHTVSHNPAAAEGKWSMMLLPIAIIIKRPLIELTGSQHTFPRHFRCWYCRMMCWKGEIFHVTTADVLEQILCRFKLFTESHAWCQCCLAKYTACIPRMNGPSIP
jgi:hypothetical protein